MIYSVKKIVLVRHRIKIHTTLVNLAPSLPVALTLRYFIGLVESSKSGVGANWNHLMLLSIGLVVPVSCPRDLLWLCPVSHAVLLTIAQRHWREGKREARGGSLLLEIQVGSTRMTRSSTKSQSGSMTSYVSFGRSIRFALFGSAFPGFSLGFKPSEKPRKPGQTGENQIELILFSLKIRCWLDVNYKFIERH